MLSGLGWAFSTYLLNRSGSDSCVFNPFKFDMNTNPTRPIIQLWRQWKTECYKEVGTCRWDMLSKFYWNHCRYTYFRGSILTIIISICFLGHNQTREVKEVENEGVNQRWMAHVVLVLGWGRQRGTDVLLSKLTESFTVTDDHLFW